MSSAPWTPMDHFNYISDRIYKLRDLKIKLRKNEQAAQKLFEELQEFPSCWSEVKLDVLHEKWKEIQKEILILETK